jgi:beta-galactosidase
MGQAIASVWCDVLRAESAEVIAVYKSEYYKGKPAITKNKFGKGYVYYIGCDLDQASLNSLLKIITDDLEITKSIFTTPNGIETVQKVSNGKTHFYLLNHNAYQTYAQFEGVFRDIISGKRYENGIMLEPFGIAVMTE